MLSGRARNEHTGIAAIAMPAPHGCMASFIPPSPR